MRALLLLALLAGCQAPSQVHESWSLTIAADDWRVSFPMALHDGPDLEEWADRWRLSLGNGSIERQGDVLVATGTGITVFEAHYTGEGRIGDQHWSDGQPWRSGHATNLEIHTDTTLDAFSLFHEATSRDCFLEERYQAQGGPGTLQASGTTTVC